jgi:hypothetical protein
MIPSLNSRLFLIKRHHNTINKNRLKRIGDSLYTAKIRNGCQLLGKVSTEEVETSQTMLNKFKVTKKIAHFMSGKRLLDKNSNKGNN